MSDDILKAKDDPRFKPREIQSQDPAFRAGLMEMDARQQLYGIPYGYTQAPNGRFYDAKTAEDAWLISRGAY